MSYIIVLLLVSLMAFGVSRQAITYPHEKWHWLLVSQTKNILQTLIKKHNTFKANNFKNREFLGTKYFLQTVFHVVWRSVRWRNRHMWR